MPWWRRLLGGAPTREVRTVLTLRVTRFRHLLDTRAALDALIEDAAEKQGGGFVLDRQYVVTVVEQAGRIAEDAVFDLSVVTSLGDVPLFETVERLQGELRATLAEGSGAMGAEETSDEGREPPGGTSSVSPAALARALAAATALFRDGGQVACRGVAAGTVRNLAGGASLADTPAASVLVAEDLRGDGAAVLSTRRPSAILLDRGTAAGPAARLARELRVPAILALGDVTAQLPDGAFVTVDADENVVYLGEVPELLEYHRQSRPGAEQEEEPEYVLLRAVRRAGFPLTLVPGRPAPVAGCRTLHDVVHLSASLAGDAIGEIVSKACAARGVSVPLDGGPWETLRLIRLDEPHGSARGAVPPPPLQAFLRGVATAPAGERGGTAPLCAVASGGRVLVAAPGAGGLDLLDVDVEGSPHAGKVHCQLAALGDDGSESARGAFAAAVLGRLGFRVSAAGPWVWAASRRIPLAEAESRALLLGRLLARLAAVGRRPAAGVAADIDAFLGEVA